MQSGPVLSLSPRFEFLSSDKLAEIDEFMVETESEIDHLFCSRTEEIPVDRNDDFEFSFDCRETATSPISADQLFYNGQIRPVYPVFSRDLLSGESEIEKPDSAKPPIPTSMRKLFIQDHDTPSCSSSESDELDENSPETYCVWTPRSAAAAELPAMCWKSNSTGSSKRWKLRNLIHRSNSDGNHTLVLLNSSDGYPRKRGEREENFTAEASKFAGKPVAKAVTTVGDPRRSFLPYRRDIGVVGLFANVNGLSRNLNPF